MRETYKPLTASLTGIDGAGKSSVADIVTTQLPPTVDIAKISRPVYVVARGVKEKRYSRLMGFVDKVHTYADSRQSKKLSMAANAVDVFAQGRIIEPGLKHSIHPHLVLGTRDYLVDPSVYSVFYSNFLSRKSVEERLKVFKKITGSNVRDVIFFLTVPPDEAVSRIEKRIEEEAKGSDTARPKWRHMHEREDHLERLQKEYYAVLSSVGMMAETKIYKVETSKYSKTQVADMITSILETHLKQ